MFEAHGSESRLDGESPNCLGLTLGCVEARYMGRLRDGGRKLVQAKNYSHWPLAYPRTGQESMPQAVNFVPFQIRSMTVLSNSPSLKLDVSSCQREHWIRRDFGSLHAARVAGAGNMGGILRRPVSVAGGLLGAFRLVVRYHEYVPVSASVGVGTGHRGSFEFVRGGQRLANDWFQPVGAANRTGLRGWHKEMLGIATSARITCGRYGYPTKRLRLPLIC